MTKKEMQKILQILGLDYEAEPSLIYVFFEHPDGRIDNFSVSLRRGRKMTDKSIVELMRKEYPATRDGEVVAVERPGRKPRSEEWLDSTDVCNMLKISKRTLRSWKRQGLFSASTVNGKNYYRRTDIEQLLKDNVVQENGRIDRTVLLE